MSMNAKVSLRLFGCLLCFCFTMVPLASAQDSGTGLNFMSEEDEWEADDVPELQVQDPYENWNRKVFNFNHKLYKHVFKPLSKGYDFLIPNRVQKGLNNAFSNMRMPVRFFNCTFQGKFKGAGTEVGRFMVNTTAGIGGLLDPAEHALKLKSHDEDFGQTMAYHGLKEGSFFVWPIIGPSTRRDSIGTIIDNAFDPLFWFGTLDVVMSEDALFAISTTKRINNYSYNIRDNYDTLIDTAIDPYIALQNAYINNRNKEIKE